MMMAELRRWLDERSSRERRMLAVCALLSLLLLGWLLVYRPVHGWRMVSADVLAQAVIRETAIGTAERRLKHNDRPSFDGDLEAVTRERAEAAGLVVSFGMADTGDLGFVVERTSTGAVMTWLSGLEQAGVRIVSLSIVENADATVTAQGGLARSHAR